MLERLLILWHFAATRWLPAPGPRWREWRRRRFLARVRRDSPFHRGCRGEVPILTKAAFLEHFADLNRHGITLEEATSVALRAERERDFRPELPGGVTVGLSSGTSGRRQVFLVGRSERCRWAGQILGRMLEPASLRQVLNPSAPPLTIAFFLRANSNLYKTLGGRRVRFDYYDLTHPFGALIEGLQGAPPDVLIAPATVLPEIAKAVPGLRPRQVISVAEVLDARDRRLVEETYALRVAEIYQAAEGFLGCSCREGRIHLNEENLQVEPHWLDETQERFHPVVTDFSRTTQWFVRHRLDDVLRFDPTPCPCGRRTRSLLGIEGRAEEILWLCDAGGKPAPLFPDSLRQAIYAMDEPPQNYRIEQRGTRWEIRLKGADTSRFDAALVSLIAGLGLQKPALVYLDWSDQVPAEKQKRIRCHSRPT